MKNGIMATYAEIMNVMNPVTGLPIYFEYSSKYRRVVVLLDGSTWLLRVSYKSDARHLAQWTKTYGAKEDAFGWANAVVSNRNVLVSPSFTIIEPKGTIIINNH